MIRCVGVIDVEVKVISQLIIKFSMLKSGYVKREFFSTLDTVWDPFLGRLARFAFMFV